jgi:hypothetical protein
MLGYDLLKVPSIAGLLFLGVYGWEQMRRRQSGAAPVQHEARFSGDDPHAVRSLWAEWQVDALRTLPLRIISRAWGAMNRWEIPVGVRPVVLGAYAWLFGCNLGEAAEPELR